MPASTTTHRSLVRPRAREGGFTLVEIIIVLVIVAILMAVVAPRFLGVKSATYAKETRAAGAAYAQAISQYQGDNHNRNPTATAWPATGPAAKKGPLNLLGKPYLPTVPEGITGGRVGLDRGTNCGANGGANGVASPGSRYGQVSICFNQGPAPAYGVRVATRSDLASTTWKVCWFGRTASGPTC